MNGINAHPFTDDELAELRQRIEADWYPMHPAVDYEVACHCLLATIDPLIKERDDLARRLGLARNAINESERDNVRLTKKLDAALAVVEAARRLGLETRMLVDIASADCGMTPIDAMAAVANCDYAIDAYDQERSDG